MKLPMLQQYKLQSILLISLGLLIPQVYAAPATLFGANFDVIYDDSLLGLFGAPTLSGNTVFFTPTSFKAESLNGIGIATANSTLNLRIIEKNNKSITAFSLVEAGDYRLLGSGSFVTIGGQTRVFDLLNPAILDTKQITTTSNLSIVNIPSDPTTHNWTSSSLISLSDPKWSDTTSFNYTIENLLTAYTEPTGSGPKLAFIEKKFAGSTISLVVTTIPEPDTYAMFLAGLGFMGFISRRKNH